MRDQIEVNQLFSCKDLRSSYRTTKGSQTLSTYFNTSETKQVQSAVENSVFLCSSNSIILPTSVLFSDLSHWPHISRIISSSITKILLYFIQPSSDLIQYFITCIIQSLPQLYMIPRRRGERGQETERKTKNVNTEYFSKKEHF